MYESAIREQFHCNMFCNHVVWLAKKMGIKKADIEAVREE